MLEELIYMILRGVIIGIVVSAPMGPVGIFCIQRTLDKGRKSGFYTGVGAAVSDLIYCILTGFCLSFIEEFINDHRSPIQIIGSSVLIGFGIWLIKKKPDSRAVTADAAQGMPSAEGDILKGFALTFSNPLILFLIIGLFAQFNFVIEGMTFWHYMLGFIGIIAGALGWWWIVTFSVDKIRGHFTQRTMKLINTVVGVIILIFAAVGVFSATSLYAHSATSAGIGMTVSFRVADKSMKGWKAEFADSVGSGFELQVVPFNVSDPFGDSERDALKITAVDKKTGRSLAGATLKDNIDPYKGSNSWRASREGSSWRIYAGNRDFRHVMTFTADMGVSSPPEITAFPGGKIDVLMMGLESENPFGKDLMRDDFREAIESIPQKKIDLSGIYLLFDFDHDDTYASLGGEYRLAVVPSQTEDAFDIIYLSGARIYGKEWKEGMRKGVLKASPFGNIYDVEWVDAEGGKMGRDVKADFDPLSRLLTVRFPYQNTTLRFRKE